MRRSRNLVEQREKAMSERERVCDGFVVTV